MHGLLITFTSALSLDQVESTFSDYADALNEIPGLLTKAWLQTDDGFGGFHLFETKAAAEGYLGSELAAGLVGTDGFTDFRIEHFDVLDGLSARTGIGALSALAAS